MSVREAGAGREGKGWVYSGMAFRMAQDMGLNLDSGINKNNSNNPKDYPIDEKEMDVRRVTFWGWYVDRLTNTFYYRHLIRSLKALFSFLFLELLLYFPIPFPFLFPVPNLSFVGSY